MNKKSLLFFAILLITISSVSAFSVWSYYESFGKWVTGGYLKSVDGLISSTPKPDLLISLVVVKPENPKMGDWVNIEVQISNGGNKDADNVIIKYFYDGREIGKESLELIKIDSTKDSSLRWQLNKEGSHVFKVVIDPDNDVDESNDNNNYKERKVYVLWSQVTTCMDSDSGLNYETPGKVTSNLYEAVGGYKKDVCPTKYLLVEYYCEGYIPLSQGYNCQYGCVDGACIKGGKSDLKVLDIKFEPEKPVAGETIKINTLLEIDETSSVYGKSFEIGLHYNDETFGWTAVGYPSYTVKKVYGRELPVVSFEWAPKEAKDYTIRAWADVSEDIDESNEKNNYINRTLTVLEKEVPCTDSDNGVNIYKKGKTQTEKIELVDECQGNMIIEYYCEADEIKRHSERCKVECADGACKKEKEEVIAPTEIPPGISEKLPEIEEKPPKVPLKPVCDGCLRGNECTPRTSRIASEYCDVYGILRAQKVDYESCSYNFECIGNNCYKGKCIKKGGAAKFKLWLKMLFG